MEWLPVPALGGVNLFDDSRALRGEEVQLARNLVPARPGILKKRGGLSRPFTAMAPTDINLPAAVVMSPLSQGVYDAVAFMRSSGAEASVTGVPFGNTPLSFAATVPFDNPRPHLLPWSGKVYVLPGPHAVWTGPSRYPFYVYDVAAETAAVLSTLPLAGTGNDNVYPAYAFPYKQRLALANFGKGYENTIAFTDDFTADVVGDDLLSSNGRAISLVAGADGDEIVAGIEVMLTNVGSPAEAGLLILRRYGDPFLLTGDMDQTSGGQSTLDIKRISVKTGCAGQYTVARTPVGIIWAGADDVWCFAAGVLPHRIGQKIQPALRQTSVQLQYRWSAAYFEGFYRLAVWGADQSFTTTDAPGDQWWLDLREGLPQDWRSARWWGPQQFLGGASEGVAPRPQTWGLMAESRAGREPRLYYIDRVEISPATYGGVIGEYGADIRDMTAFAAYIADADYVDPEIVTELVTKEYALAPPYQQVNDGIAGTIRTLHDVRLTATYSLDDGAVVLARNKYIKAVSPFQLDADPLNTAGSTLNNKVSPFSIYPAVRQAASSHQFKLADTAGWTIVAGHNDTIVAGVSDAIGGDSIQWTATIAAGVYTISELATAVAAAISAERLFGDAWAGAIVAGLVTFSATNITDIAIFLSFVGASPDVGDTPTAAQVLSSCRLGAILGFDVSTTAASAISMSPTLAGASAPFKKGVASFELYGLQANFEVIPREP